jgi:hypothetical protein
MRAKLALFTRVKCHLKAKEHTTIMKNHLGLMRLLVVVAAIVLGVIQGLAQTTATEPAKKSKMPQQASQVTAPAPQDKVWIKDPNSVMPMRKMTLAERHAAARRNQERKAKAEAQRKQNAPANQGVR